jgi:hypothetical protein
MSGHIAVKDAPPVMRDNEETVEGTEDQRKHGEETLCAIALRWLLKNADLRFANSGFLGAFLIQRSTERSEISRPSIFNSP